MNCYDFRIKTASAEDIISHLSSCAVELDLGIDLNEYGKKIFENATTFEYWDGECLIGLVAVYYNDLKTKRGYITDVSIVKEFRRKGIASKLLNIAIDYGKKNGFQAIELEVDENNTLALALYKKYGFTQSRTSERRRPIMQLYL